MLPFLGDAVGLTVRVVRVELLDVELGSRHVYPLGMKACTSAAPEFGWPGVACVLCTSQMRVSLMRVGRERVDARG